jgi:hypothetical protein
MERVALARLVNDEIRALAERLHAPGETHTYAWMCACGCFTIVSATLTEYDARGGQVLAAGHPLDEERIAATEAFQREPDPSAVAARVDAKKRRELTTDLARRLERQVMANNCAT